MSKVLLVLGLLSAVVLSNAETLKIGESSGWEVVSDGQSKVEFKQGKKQLKAIVALKKDGGWIILKKVFKKDFAPNTILSFKIKADADFDLETNFVKIDGSVHNKRGSLKDKYKEWTEVKIPLNSIKRGWKVKRNPAAGSEIQFGFSGKGKGFVSLADFKIISPGAWTVVKDWRVIAGGKSSLKLSSVNKETIKADFNLSGEHGWALMEHSLKNDLAQNTAVTFEIKTAFTGELEVKFVDKNGQVNCRKIRMGKNPEKWQKITVFKRDCGMKWKIGAPESAQLQIGFSGNGKGVALLRSIYLDESAASPKSAAQTGKVTASSGDGNYLPRFAFDNDMKTRWASGSGDVEWLQIEFARKKYLSGMTIIWETAYSQKYDILTSLDGKKWQKVSSTEEGDGHSDRIYFKGHFARFLKIATRKRGTGWGNSIWDIQLQGKEQEPIVKVSSAQGNHSGANVIDGNKKTFWKSKGKAQEVCELDLTAAQGIGGVVLRWGKNFPAAYVIESSLDGKKWTKAAAREVTNGGTDIVYFSPVNLRFLRLLCRQAAGKTIELNEIELKRDDEAASPLRLYKAVAQEYPEGYFPKWLYAKQEYWTVVGVEKGIEESLVSENATIEPFIKGFTLMPYIYMNKKLITAPQCKVSQGLINDYYPMPFITWEKNNAELKTKAWSTGTAENAATYAVYTIKNNGNKAISGKFYLAIRPIQLTPLWQHGGMSPIKNISFDNKKGAVKVNDKNALYVLNKQISFGAAKSPENDVITYMDKGKLPADTALQDNSGLISGALEIGFTIAPGQEKKVYTLMPLTAGFSTKGITSKSFDKAFKLTCDYWNKKLNKTKINIPQKELVNVLKANLAYLLINADKNSLHPGSRAYDRSWIRDGSIMCQALLDTRNFSEVKKYLEWVASCQMKNGRIPCMLELNGKMPGWAGGWCEWDGQGAYVFAVTSYYRFTKDKEFLKKMFPSVIKALKFLKQLRAQRLTAQYKGTVYYGIIPKSNSHEGYFPAQHSLWDDFWALKGWKDGQMLAAAAGQKEQIAWMKKEELGLRENLLRNIKLLQKKTGIKNIPGCFEKADFDATSTAIAIWPAFETQYLPKESLDYTLDTYYQNTLMPRYTKLTSSYTPYELRTANAYLTMGKKKKLLSMVNYFLRDMRPRKWLNWGEVVHADIETPSYIGDMPHTWIGAIAINVIRNMFVYEHNNIDLIFAAGVDPDWLKAPQGISVSNFPTYFGEVGFKMKRTGNIIETTFFGSVKGVRNILLTSPLARPIKSATVAGAPAKIINNKVVIEKFPAKVIIKY